VLVSKIKPASDVLALHSTSTSPRPIHFGENYVQELTDKAASLPRSIKWHFIGGLQSNKCKALAGIPNLWCVSSVDTVKKADLLEKGRVHVVKSDGDKARLRIMVQVNTSGEESKSGVEPGDAVALCRHVKEQCPSLRLAGLMTIGAIARSKATTAETENEDFTKLVEVRDAVAQELDMPTDDLELSMGMSSDYEGAITHGSNEVRIGTTIFGERPSKRNSGPSGQDTS
jgi:pyridoxal phosphate enzyme (YggS family)